MADWLPDAKPEWWGDIKAFVANPAGFVLGVVLSTVLGGFFGAVEFVIGAIQTLLIGNDEWFGLAELPEAIITPFLSAGSTIGLAGLRAIASVNEAIKDVVGATGPFEVIIGTALWSVWILIGVAGFYALVSVALPVSASGGLSTLRGRIL